MTAPLPPTDTIRDAGARRLEMRRLADQEYQEAASLLIASPDSTAAAKTHLERAEAIEKALAHQSVLQPDAKKAGLLAVGVVLTIGLLDFVEVDTVRISAEARAPAIGIAQTADDAGISFEPDNLKIISGAGFDFVGDGLQHVRGHTFSVSSGLLRISILTFGTGPHELSLQYAGRNRIEIRADGSATTVDLSAERGPVVLESLDTQTTVRADEFLRASAGGSATLLVGGSAISFPVSGANLAFTQASASDYQLDRPQSVLQSAKVTIQNLPDQTSTLDSTRPLSIEGFTGQLTVSPDDGLLVRMEGTAAEVRTGPRGYEHSLKPSLLVAWFSNARLSFLGAGFAALWSFLWAARKLLLR